jgi:hypothetical protein
MKDLDHGWADKGHGLHPPTPMVLEVFFPHLVLRKQICWLHAMDVRTWAFNVVSEVRVVRRTIGASILAERFLPRRMAR